MPGGRQAQRYGHGVGGFEQVLAGKSATTGRAGGLKRELFGIIPVDLYSQKRHRRQVVEQVENVDGPIQGSVLQHYYFFEHMGHGFERCQKHEDGNKYPLSRIVSASGCIGFIVPGFYLRHR